MKISNKEKYVSLNKGSYALFSWVVVMLFSNEYLLLVLCYAFTLRRPYRKLKEEKKMKKSMRCEVKRGVKEICFYSLSI